MYNLYAFSTADVLNSVDEDNNVPKEGLLSNILHTRSSVSRLVVVEGVKETDITGVELRTLRPRRAIKLPRRS